MSIHQFFRPDLLELAAAYDDYGVLVTTAELDLPGPQILYVNSAFTRMTGYAIRDVLGKTPRILQGPKSDHAVLQQLRKSLEAGEDFIARATNYKCDGTEFQMEWIISHLRNATGQTTHYVAMQRDITGLERAHKDFERYDAELRTAGEQLIAATQKLEAAERRMIQRERAAALGQMAAGVVHDLRNALTPIASFVNDLNTLQELTPRAREAIDGIVVSVAHGLELLRNLDSVCATGKPSPLDETVDLGRIIERIPQLLQPRIENHAAHSQGRVEIRLDIGPVSPVIGNAVELTQVLVNLVSNSIDAMPTGGVITIRLESREESVILTVSDTGPGIPPHLIDRCFEAYVTTKQEGSGLGLSVCQGIIQRHQGHIEVSNTAPNGSAVFTIQLPAAVAVESVPAPAASPSNAGQRLLYIDDDEGCRVLMARWLARVGYDVTTAADGDTGLRLAHEGNYDIVLTDTRMTPTSGIDVAMVLTRTRPQLPVILVSGALLAEHELPDALRNCEQLLKPFTPEDVNIAVSRAAQAVRRPRVPGRT